MSPSSVPSGCSSHHRRTRWSAFSANSRAIGFFLNKEKVKAAIYDATAFFDQSGPLPCLVNAIYLWGIVLCASPVLSAQESVFLSKSLSAIGIPSQYSDDTLQKVQTHILLSNYFMRCGHTKEGKSHSSTAMWLAMRSGFHKSAPSPSIASLTPGMTDPADNVAAFWAAYYLDKCWGILLTLPSACPDQRNPSDEDRIDVPWPVDVDKLVLVSDRLNLSSHVVDRPCCLRCRRMLLDHNSLSVRSHAF